MTAEPLFTTDLSADRATTSPDTGTTELTRRSWAVVEPRADEVGSQFYAILFHIAPEVRDLFPVNLEVHRSRLIRALVHVAHQTDDMDELLPFLHQLGRDHRKFGVRPEHYDAVTTALVGGIRKVSGEAWTPEVEDAWRETLALAATAMRTAADTERGPASWMGRVVEHTRHGWDIATLTVQTSEPLPYRAGQYLSIETPQRPRLWRYLSPANAPRQDGTIDFHVRAVPGGWVSRAIVAHANVGDTWRIGSPMGRMGVRPDSDRELLMVAGGTGVAPIKALLDDLSQRQRQPRTQVFVGGRTWEDLYDFDALRRLSYAGAWLDVVPVVEQDDRASGAERGTLADVVTRYGAWADHDVLVSGSPAMIRATVSRMLVAGTPLDRITYDPFTME
ncbi:globin domain-containing protein [Pseudonocardia asaccharolytica]|uniref:nitric oxide dioxygenase n=1 Tax=Pseudonocardia asaccharolytica DSM 44247 = NBRC 16224 TaxID=1123024 RepID=A0A511D0T0_9PSEU|nr:globin domain-containing protein [Pseudonocardia asaccharolytica]GEL18392.1 flavohemoprotein [Pseudonocardia asaccharolytica DSM 44247 = NBRC 16224]